MESAQRREIFFAFFFLPPLRSQRCLPVAPHAGASGQWQAPIGSLSVSRPTLSQQRLRQRWRYPLPGRLHRLPGWTDGCLRMATTAGTSNLHSSRSQKVIIECIRMPRSISGRHSKFFFCNFIEVRQVLFNRVTALQTAQLYLESPANRRTYVDQQMIYTLAVAS